MLLRIGLISVLLFRLLHADEWRHEELRRFPAAEAVQGVAVDETFFYAITNRAIGKYRKDTGERVARWEDAPDGRLRHLNAGIVIDGKLHCAHSNFPKLPEESSIEVWDTATMRHLETIPLAKPPGSLTWVVPRDGHWFACFAHYRSTGDPANSRLVKFDADWKPVAEWRFPARLIERFAGSSASGGAFGPGGFLFASGHDATELYRLELPVAGGEVRWLGTVPMSAAGQAFAWDPTGEGILYSIQRKTKEVIVSRVFRQGNPDKPGKR
jgi:outer membrane protein assembly factor BamB